MGEMLGKEFNTYFPIVLVLFCIITLFNLYTRFVTNCCFKRFHKFVFDETFSEAQIERGKEIISHERELRDGGTVPSPVKSKKVEKSKGSKEEKTERTYPNVAKIFGNSRERRPDGDVTQELLEKGERRATSQW